MAGNTRRISAEAITYLVIEEGSFIFQVSFSGLMIIYDKNAKGNLMCSGSNYPEGGGLIHYS